MNRMWEEGLSWDPCLKRFLVDAEVTSHNVPTQPLVQLGPPGASESDTMGSASVGSCDPMSTPGVWATPAESAPTPYVPVPVPMPMYNPNWQRKDVKKVVESLDQLHTKDDDLRMGMMSMQGRLVALESIAVRMTQQPMLATSMMTTCQ